MSGDRGKKGGEGSGKGGTGEWAVPLGVSWSAWWRGDRGVRGGEGLSFGSLHAMGVEDPQGISEALALLKSAQHTADSPYLDKTSLHKPR